MAEVYGKEYQKHYNFNDYKEKKDANGVPISCKQIYTLAQVLADLYVSYRGRYNRSQMDKHGKGAVWCPTKNDEPMKLTQKTLCGHIHRKYAIHVYAGQQTSRFICFDVDEQNWTLVSKLIDIIEEYGIPRELIYPSTSGGKGYHVDVFFSDVVTTTMLRQCYAWCMSRLLDEGMDISHIEFRPTAEHSIKLPLSINHNTGNICWFLDRETGEPYAYTDYLLEIKQMDMKDFIAVSLRRSEEVAAAQERLDGLKRKKKKILLDLHPYTFDSVPAWAPKVKSRGTRHKTMMALAIRCAQRRVDVESTMKLMDMWYDAQDQSMISTKKDAALKDAELICDWVYTEGLTFMENEPKADKPKKERVRKENTWAPVLTAEMIDPNAVDGVASEEALKQQRLDPIYCIRAEDAIRCLSLNESLHRAMFFLVTAEQIATGMFGKGYSEVTMAEVAKITGYSVEGVKKAILKMEENKIIDIERRRARKSSAGYVCKRPNMYHTFPVQIVHDDWEQFATGNVWMGKVSELRSNFWHEYFAALCAVLDREYVWKKLLPKERRRLEALSETKDEEGEAA